MAPVGQVPPDRHHLLLPFCTAFPDRRRRRRGDRAGLPRPRLHVGCCQCALGVMVNRILFAVGEPVADAGSLTLTCMSGAVRHSAVVLTDATTAAQLAGYGFAHAGTSTHAAYTVSTPALRRTAVTDSAIAAVLQQAVPIAVFPTRRGADSRGRRVRRRAVDPRRTPVLRRAATHRRRARTAVFAGMDGAEIHHPHDVPGDRLTLLVAGRRVRRDSVNRTRQVAAQRGMDDARRASTVEDGIVGSAQREPDPHCPTSHRRGGLMPSSVR